MQQLILFSGVFGSDDTTNAVKWCTETKFAYPVRQSVIDNNKDLFQEGNKGNLYRIL